MRKFEMGNFEYDPSYDPEKLEGAGESEQDIDLRMEREVVRDNERSGTEAQPIDDHASEQADAAVCGYFELAIPEYILPSQGNPYRWSEPQPWSLAPIATRLDALLYENFAGQSILLRGIQSAKHSKLRRNELVHVIMVNGWDRYASTHTAAANMVDVPIDFHAAAYTPFTQESSTVGLFEGFHTWKPKCDEEPQMPIDVFMVFDADYYESVEYVNRRHGGIGADAYRLKPGFDRVRALKAVIVVN